MLSAEELTYHVGGCVLNNRESQKVIYTSFYGWAMAICDRYTNNYEDSVEILNDGFLKIFKEIHHYKPAYADVVASFKGWSRKIMIYTAIDHLRKYRRHKMVSGLDFEVYQFPSINEDAFGKMSHKEIINAIRDLSPACQTVFHLFVMGGLSHEEIAKKLDISVGTSKSNLSKARKKLQKILVDQDSFSLEITT